MPKQTDNLDRLIDSLIESHQPLVPESHPWRRTLPLFVLITLFMGLMTAGIGLRSDWRPGFVTEFGMFQLELLLSFITGFTALLATGWLRVPYMKSQRWVIGLALGCATLFLSLESFRLINEGIIFATVEAFVECYQHALILAGLPTALLIYFQRSGSSTHPYLSALMGTLAIAGFAWISLRLTCSVNLAGHNAIVQLSPFMVLGAGLGLFARRLYRW